MRPSIILCSGAWHTVAHIKPVIPYFEQAGYRIIPHAGASAGQRNAWVEDVAALQDKISSELQNGAGICLILHSAAGLCGTEAINRILNSNPSARSQVLRIIYVASFIEFKEIVEPLFTNGHIHLDMEEGTSTFLKAHHGFFNDIFEAEAQPFIDALTWQNMYDQPDIDTSGPWRDVPLTYLICTEDNAVAPAVQERTAERYGMETVRMKAGHCPFVTQPGKFVDVTGIYYYNPHVDQGPQALQPDNTSGETEDIGIAFTVTQFNNSRLQDASWLYVSGANYSDDFSLGYDVCGMNFGPFPDNTNYRGQADNGSCTTMFDTDCVNAIEQAVQQYALELTSNPTPDPNSNLTQQSLPGVCNTIGEMLQNNIPDECSKYVNGSTRVASRTPLTGYNGSVIETDCTIRQNNRTWYELISYTVDYSSEAYALIAQSVTPIIAVWMPIANSDRPSTIVTAKAGMVCVNVNHFNPGSVVPAALPAPTPVGGGGGLSGGAIAGIVVGVVVGVALIAGLAAWWFLARRRKSKKSAELPANENTIGMSWNTDTKHTQDSPVEVPAEERPLAELENRGFRPELDGGKDNQVFESDAKVGAPAVELEGSAPNAPK
ncbi:hypothetical protein PRZ48_014004 [Zasmidium cellare]|uniref:AB hydrolase-1 domain-containing protein n=1 Tax=Zasmidium cellare TaxID=395010 RepID=A0ABR0E092_ZASCE|nr:hypothetical protein PRZ48_014004 [Zasmidium cellare]